MCIRDRLGLQPGQVVRHQRDTDADAHRLGRLDLRMEGRLHLLELLHHRSRMALQAQPPLGEREFVVGADEQRAAELGFPVSYTHLDVYKRQQNMDG